MSGEDRLVILPGGHGDLHGLHGAVYRAPTSFGAKEPVKILEHVPRKVPAKVDAGDDLDRPVEVTTHYLYAQVLEYGGRSFRVWMVDYLPETMAFAVLALIDADPADVAAVEVVHP